MNCVRITENWGLYPKVTRNNPDFESLLETEGIYPTVTRKTDFETDFETGAIYSTATRNNPDFDFFFVVFLHFDCE